MLSGTSVGFATAAAHTSKKGFKEFYRVTSACMQRNPDVSTDVAFTLLHEPIHVLICAGPGCDQSAT